MNRSHSLRSPLNPWALLLAALLLLPAPNAAAQNSTTPMLSATVTHDECDSCDLGTQEAIASEDDRHDEMDAGFDADVRSENVDHDETDQSIEQSNSLPEVKQENLANEEERHENALTAIERDREIEASRHEQNLAGIMAKAGKLLSDLVQNVIQNGSSPSGGSAGGANNSGGTPSTGGGAQSGGSTNYPGVSPGGVPRAGGNPSGPGTAPSGGGNPVAGGGQPSNGGNPTGGGSAPGGGNNPIAGGGSPNSPISAPGGATNPVNSGGAPNSSPSGTEYPGTQANNPSQPSSAPPNPSNQGHGALKGLNDWINGIAQKMAPPPSTGTGQPYTGPLAINGHSPLYYLNEGINNLANSLPGGSNSLQQASQATNQFANQNFRDQWTQPMSPQAAAGQVGGAFAGAAVGKGLGAAAGVLKNAFSEAAANGASNAGALRAAAGSLGAAASTGVNAAKQEAGTLSGFASAGNPAGSVGGAPGAGENPTYNGGVAEDGAGGGPSGGGPNGSDPGGSFPPENPGSGGGAPAPGGSEPIVFSEDTPPNIGQTVTKFELGAQGGSIKSITPQTFGGKTWQGVVQQVGKEGGGWKSAGPGKWVSNNGQWTATEAVPESIDPSNPNKVPIIFLENQDGGVIRIKPMGVPQGSLKSMQNPHYALYEKINPTGDTSWNNEAFKVDNGAAIPKAPALVEPPPGMPKYSQLGEEWLQNNPGKPFPPGNVAAYYSPEFDNYLNASGWVNAAHQPLAPGTPWSPGSFAGLMGGGPN